MQVFKSTKARKAARPWACAATDPTRYALEGVRIRPSDTEGYVRAEATDGRKLVSVLMKATEGDAPPDDGIIVPSEAWKDAYRKATAKVSARLEANGKIELQSIDGAKAEYPALEDRFPDTDSLIKNPPGHARVALDVRHLAAIADALGTDFLELHIPEPDDKDDPGVSRPLLVEPIYGIEGDAPENSAPQGSFGVLATVSRPS